MSKIKETFSGAPKGSRKQSVNTLTMFFMLAGFTIAAWMKVDFQLFLVYAAGVAGSNGFFVWGNSKEHQANAQNPQATTTTSSSSTSSSKTE